jgi:multidrug efflux system outer membrane protein
MFFLRQFHILASSLTLLFLLGCAHTYKDSPTLGFSLPEQWQASSVVKLDPNNDRWIHYFKDNEQLRGLIEKGLASNYNLSIANSRVLIAQAELKAINPNQLPEINLQMRGARQKYNTISAFSPPGIVNDYSLNLGLNWELDFWGKLNNQKQSVAFNYKATEEDFKYARISLASQIAKIWLNIMHAKGQLELSKKIIDTYSKIEQSMLERYQGGLVTASDYLKAKANKDSLYEEQLRLEKETAILTRSLEVLLGEYPSAKNLTYTPLPNLHSRIPVGLPSELLLNRPDILAAEQRVQSTIASIKNAQKRRFPQFSLTGTLGHSSDTLKDLLDSKYSSWSVASGIAQPFINHGKIKAGIDQAKSRFSEAEASYNQTVLIAFSEVENALSNESFLFEQWNANNRQLIAALESARIGKESYIHGTEDFLTFMNALINAFRMEQNNLSLKRLQLENRIDLYHALGESFIES